MIKTDRVTMTDHMKKKFGKSDNSEMKVICPKAKNANKKKLISVLSEHSSLAYLTGSNYKFTQAFAQRQIQGIQHQYAWEVTTFDSNLVKTLCFKLKQNVTYVIG